MTTQERLCELLDYDAETGQFIWLKRQEISREEKRWNARYAGKTAGCINAKGYRDIGIDDRLYQAHRLAWLYVYGEWPASFIDHINGDRADNRIANLRQASNAENMRNRGANKNNASGRKGVTWHKRKRKWHAQIGVSAKRISLGCFDCPDEASRAYNAAAVRLHGEFANTGDRQ